MKIDLNEVAKSIYTLEEVLVLVEIECKRRGLRFPYSKNKKEEYINLCKKGILTVNTEGYKISVTGLKAFRKIIGNTSTTFAISASTTQKDKFKEFWGIFPISDKHGNWLRTRLLRNNREKTEKNFYIAIDNGTSADNIIKALKWEIVDRENNSKISNKLTYMKSSSVWLSSTEYALNLEVMKNFVEVNKDINWTEDTV